MPVVVHVIVVMHVIVIMHVVVVMHVIVVSVSSKWFGDFDWLGPTRERRLGRSIDVPQRNTAFSSHPGTVFELWRKRWLHAGTPCSLAANAAPGR